MNNNKQLLQYHNDIEKISGTILYQFHRSKIKDFYHHNGIRINTLMEKIQKLAEEFLVIEGEGEARKIKYTEPAIIHAVYKTENIPNKWHEFGHPKTKKVLIIPDKKIPSEAIFQDGKTKEEYEKKYNELMDEEVNIVF